MSRVALALVRRVARSVDPFTDQREQTLAGGIVDFRPSEENIVCTGGPEKGRHARVQVHVVDQQDTAGDEPRPGESDLEGDVSRRMPAVMHEDVDIAELHEQGR